MKTITYGLLIYTCLTTIVCKATPERDIYALGKCTRTANDVIQKYLKDAHPDKKCDDTVKPYALLPPLDTLTFDIHLCAAIFDTMKIICNLNSSLSLNETVFISQMDKLLAEIKNRDTLSTEMSKILSNSSYQDIINSTAHQEIAVLNKQLLKDFAPTCASVLFSYNALCSVLLCVNKLLVDTKISVSKRAPVEVLTTQEQKHASNPLILHKVARDPPKKEKDLKKQHADNAPVMNAMNTHNASPIETQQPKPAGKAVNVAKLAPADKGAGDMLQANAKSEDKAEFKQDKQDKRPDNAAEADVLSDRTNKAENKVKTEITTQAAATVPPSEDEKQPSVQAPDQGNDVKDEKGVEQTTSNQEEKNTVAQDQHSKYPVQSDLEPPQHFFGYFMAVSLICLICYIGYHKKHKIMGIIFEGRKSRGGRGRRRPNTAGYRKLDCTLEEAVTSQCNSNVTHVIY